MTGTLLFSAVFMGQLSVRELLVYEHQTSHANSNNILQDWEQCSKVSNLQPLHVVLMKAVMIEI